jgi:hypothetical protein
MTTVTESIHIDADPDTVYGLITDVASVGQFSPEAATALRAPSDLAVGHRFWGVNRRGPWLWITRCRVTRADPGRGFAFDVDMGPLPISTWEYEITDGAPGCIVTETWTDRRTGIRGRIIAHAGSVVIPGPRDEHNRANIRASLTSLKALAEAREPDGRPS